LLVRTKDDKENIQEGTINKIPFNIDDFLQLEAGALSAMNIIGTGSGDFDDENID